MQNIVTPSKTVDEVITVEFNFQDAVPINAVITSVDMVIGVTVGIDNTPRRILKGSPVIVAPYVSATVTQKIYDGIPGVIYSITCRATFDDGTICEDMGLLAITRGYDLYPPFIAKYRSSEIYPIGPTDDNAFNAIPLEGLLKRLAWLVHSNDNNSQFNALPIGGHLRSPLVVYQYKDTSNTFSALPTGGLLKDVLVSYQYKGESSQFSASAQTGMLKTSLITYTYRGESSLFSATPMSGALS